MSTNVQRRQIKACKEISINDNVASVRLAESARLRDLTVRLTGQEIHLEQHDAVVSSAEVRETIQSSFPATASKLETVIGKENAMKVAFVKAISESPVAVKNENKILEVVEKLINSNDEKEIKAQIITGIQVIEKENNRVFAETLLSAHKNASIAAGFTNIRTSNEGNVIRLIAENENNQLLVSEISVDSKNASVNTETETIGFEGAACEKAIEQFEKSLKEAGVVAKQCNKKPTGGKPVMQFARSLVNYRSKKTSKTGLRPASRSNTILIQK